MHTTTALIKAKALIRDKGWVQFVPARDKLGLCVTSKSSHAVCFCMTGALGRVTRGYDEFVAAVQRLEQITKISVADWNDTQGRTKEEVLEVFDRAIAAGD